MAPKIFCMTCPSRTKPSGRHFYSQIADKAVTFNKVQSNQPDDDFGLGASSGCATSKSLAVDGNFGTSQRNSRVAANPPPSWATINKGTSLGRMPAKVSLSDLAM